VCCWPVLYVWLISHTRERLAGISCPVELVIQQKMEVKEANEWSQFLAGLIQLKIQWQPFWHQQAYLIYQCAQFPNVPLIGTKVCMNCNPVLAQRQFGYPIRGAPTSAVPKNIFVLLWKCFCKHYAKSERFEGMLFVQRDSISWAYDKKITYYQWVIEGVKKVKLPFRLISSSMVIDEPILDELT